MARGLLLAIGVALVGPGARVHASKVEPPHCSAGNQQDGVCSRPSALAQDHQLLQTKGSLSTVGQHQDEVRAPGDFGQNQRSASPCGSMHNVKRSCSGNGCKVLAGGMTGRTCRQYCQDSGLSCTAAWEEVSNDCNVKATMTCDQVWPRTSDLLCECAPAPARNASKLRLVWSDDFDGNGVDSSKWSILSAGGGFGNQEKQFYTNHADMQGSYFLPQGVAATPIVIVPDGSPQAAVHAFMIPMLQSGGMQSPAHLEATLRATAPDVYED